MADSFYPFVENGAPRTDGRGDAPLEATQPARVAVYDDAAAAPRVVVVEPSDVRSYLEEITATVNRLAHEQGGSIPFTVIRECVENLIHAYFSAPTVSILDGGDTIRFSDQGPGIADKRLALEYGTSSATEEMKRYIRGVGSGLPYASQYMEDKGGSLTIEDNIQGGCVVTISLVDAAAPREDAAPAAPLAQAPAQPYPQPAYPQQAYPQQTYPQPAYPQPQPGWGAPQQPAPWPQAQPAYPQPQPAWGVAPQPQPWGWTAPQAPAAPVELNATQERALRHLVAAGPAGPSDLVAAYGAPSAPTWSRALKALADAGFARKQGQRHRATQAGLDWAATHPLG